MIETLVKSLLENKTESGREPFRDLINGYKDFEKVCSMWNTFIYIADYREAGDYSYISPSFCNYLGVKYSNVLDANGFEVVSAQIHPEDKAIISSKIYPKISNFLTSIKQQDKNYTYKFSYNFRIKVKDGSYTRVSLVSRVLKYDDTGKILLEFGLIAPINYGELSSDKIVLNIYSSTNDEDYVIVFHEELHIETKPSINLTEREWEIINLIKSGKDSKGIAEELFLSQHTVRNHRKNILRKTNTNKVTELLILLSQNNL